MLNINIYIEKYLSENNTVVEYTIDFDSIETAKKLLSTIGNDIEYSSPKFYKLVLPYMGKKRMFSGSWYSIPLQWFKNAIYQEIGEEDAQSAAYSGTIKIEGLDLNTNFSKYLTHIQSTTSKLSDQININFNSSLKELVVVDCGQGNWNEIHSNEKILIYDMGASSHYTVTRIKKLISSRFSTFQNKNLIVVISHWDMDHFQSLKYLEFSQMQQIVAVYGPSNLPASNVYNDTMNNLRSNNVKCFFIAPTSKRNGRSIDLNLIFSSNAVDVYRAVGGNSRNQTGIILAAKGIDKIALLTGDHHYDKIFNAVENKYTKRDIVFVAPHHGGNSGNLSVKQWLTEFGKIECPISVGVNSYNHPNQNISGLTQLQKRYPDTTQLKGNIRLKI
jgi:beta-lactamase superfamily II metal-dependent hydrolase